MKFSNVDPMTATINSNFGSTSSLIYVIRVLDMMRDDFLSWKMYAAFLAKHPQKREAVYGPYLSQDKVC